VSKANKAGHAAPPPTAPRRLNLRALIVLGVGIAVVVPGFVVLRSIQAKRSTSSHLDAARQALDKGQVDVALSFVNAYLQGNPQSIEALELKGRILSDIARDFPTVQEAIHIQTQILALEPARMDARKRLIELNLRIGRFRAAQEAAQTYLELGADDAEAHRLMARALEGVGYLGDASVLDGSLNVEGKKPPYNAISEFEKAEKLKPGDVDGGSRLAEIYVTRGKEPARAVEVMDKILDSNPKSVAARLARFHFFLRHPELAAKSTEAAEAEAAKASLAEHELAGALKLAPGDADARMLAAEDAVARGDTTAARAHLAAIEPPPKDELRMNLIKGMIEFKEQRPDEAIQSWRAGLIQAGGTNADLHWRLARILIGLNRLPEARQHMAQYRRLVGGKEPNAEYRYLDALIGLRAGRVKAALAELEATRDKLSARGPLSAALQLVTLGDAYAANRDEARAIDTYAQAADTPGSGAQPWLAIARLHQILGRPADAIDAMEKGLARVPDDPGLLVALAQALRRRELDKPKDRRDWTAFNSRLEQAERLARDAPEVAMLRAESLADAGRLEDALKRVEAAVARAPTAVDPWLMRIAALHRLGRVDEALRAAGEARKAAGDNARFRVVEAQLLLRRGEPGPAYDVLAGGMDRVPPDQRPVLWRALGEHHQGRRDFDAARKAYEEWSRLMPESAEPRLALMALAALNNDGPAMEAQAEALRKVVGPDSVLGKVARCEVLLNLKPTSGDGRSGEDKARLDEVARLVAEIKAAAPRAPSGPLLEARLMNRLGRTDEEVAAYEAALELRGGQAALKPLVMLLVDKGDDARIEALHRKLPNFPADIDQIAIAKLMQRGEADKAEQMVDQMMQGNPQALDAAIWKVKVLNTLGKPEAAEKFLTNMVRGQPENASIWMQLLMFQASRNEADKARATLAQMRQRLKPEQPELLWAACYRALNMRSEADDEFAAAVAKWKDDPGVLQVAVDYYETTGRPEQAEPLLRHLLEVRPGFDWARRRLALNLSARPNNPAALAEAMGLVGAPSPGEAPDDRKLRAVVFSRSEDPGRREEAIGILETLAAEVPEPERSRLHETLARSLAASSEQAKAAGDKGRADADRARALDHSAKASGAEGAPADMILFHAALLLQRGDIAGAEKELARLEKTDPKALPTIELKARILHAKGDDTAVDDLILGTFRARKAAPDALTTGINLLKLLMALKRPEAAERLGGDVAALSPRGKIAFAEFLAGRGKAKEAAAQLDAAAKSGGGAEAARASTALANELGGEWVGQADGLLSLALKSQPDSLDLLLAQAFLRHLKGDYKGEIAVYDGILSKNPTTYLFLNNMAWTLSEEMGRPQEGLQRVDEGIKRVGRLSHMVDTRGVILLRLGRDAEAIKDLEDAAAMLPSAAICYHLARAYKKAGREADFEKYRDRARKAGLKPAQLQPSERDEAAKLIGFPDAAEPAAEEKKKP
jgi:tetratricopeptide (TPR) repeat protein